MALKLGVATYAFLWTHTLEEILEQMSEWGFQQVELMTTPPHIWPRTVDKTYRTKLHRVIEASGLEVVAVNPTFLDINIASPNPGFRAESVTQVKEIIRLAPDLGASILVLIPGKRHPLVPQPFEQSWQIAKASILECLPEAEQHGVILGLENAPTLFMERSEQLRRMVEEIGSEYVQVVFDTANGAPFEPLPEALEIVKDYLVHVHVSDYGKNRWAHLPVGAGQIDFGKIAARLEEIGFSGSSVIETTYLETPDGGVLASKTQLETLGWQL